MHKTIQILPLLAISTLFACKPAVKTEEVVNNQTDTVKYTESRFQFLLDSMKLDGSILIYNEQNISYHSSDFQWAAQGHLPASTFKIPNSIIALDLGKVKNDSSMFLWNGEARRLKIWEQDLTFMQAFHFSCVPCYQELARKIGHQRMNSYLQQFDYGKMIVDSSNQDLFWLEGESKISQMEQIDFLKKFNNHQLKLKESTYTIMSRMMILDSNDHYILRGKTGWSIRNGNNNGWFVGYLTTSENTYYFASNVNPTPDYNIKNFAQDRKNVCMLALKHLGVLD